MTFKTSAIGSRFCMYLRKSREDENRERATGVDTLDSHRRTLYDFADRLGIIVTEEYAEVASGESLTERPQMLRLLEDVEDDKWDGVLVVSADRLSRGSKRQQGIIAEAFIDSETYILTPLRIFDPLNESDMEIFDFDLFMSQREFKAINRRLIAGRVASCRRGEFIGSEAPYGYDKVKVDGFKTLRPNEMAPYVSLIYKLHLSGVPACQIATRLTESGVPTYRPESKGGNRWNPASVKNILTNPVYAGMIRWNATQQTKASPNSGRKYKTTFNKEPLLFEGLHEPIIDREDFAAAQEIFDSHASPFANSRIERNYYGGLLFCAECGLALHYDKHRKRHAFMHPTRRKGCANKGAKVDVIDGLIIAWLTTVAEDLEIELEAERAPERMEQISMLEKVIESTRQAIASTMESLENGQISEGEFQARQSRNAAKLEETQDMLNKLNSKTDERKKRVVRLHEAIAALKDPEFNVRAKNVLLKSVIRRINYTNHSKQGSDDKLILEIELV